MKKKPVIQLEDQDFGTILICAVRYSLGRRTYMPSLVQDFIRPLLPYLPNKTIWCLEKDISCAESYGDPHIDEPGWIHFLSGIQTEIQTRKNAGTYF